MRRAQRLRWIWVVETAHRDDPRAPWVAAAAHQTKRAADSEATDLRALHGEYREYRVAKYLPEVEA